MANFERLEAIIRPARSDEDALSGQRILTTRKTLGGEIEVTLKRGWFVGLGRRRAFLLTLNRTIRQRPLKFSIPVADAIVDVKLDCTITVLDDEIMLRRLGRFLVDTSDVSARVEAQIRAWIEAYFINNSGALTTDFAAASRDLADRLSEHLATRAGLMVKAQLQAEDADEGERVEIDLEKTKFVCSTVSSAFEAWAHVELKYLDRGLVGRGRRQMERDRCRTMLQRTLTEFLETQTLHSVLFKRDDVTTGLTALMRERVRDLPMQLEWLRLEVDPQGLDLGIHESRINIPYPVGDSQSEVKFDVRVQLQLADADTYIRTGRLSLDTIVRRAFEQALSRCLFERKRSEIAVDWSATYSREIQAEVVAHIKLYGYRAIAVVAEPKLGEQRFLRSFDIRVSGPGQDERFELGEAGQFAKMDISFTGIFELPLNPFTTQLIDQSKSPEEEIEKEIRLLVQKEAQRHLRGISPEEFHNGLRISYDPDKAREESRLSETLGGKVEEALKSTFGSFKLVGTVAVSPHLTPDDHRLSDLVGAEANRKVEIQLVGTDLPEVLVYDYGIRVTGTDLERGSWTKFRLCTIDTTDALLDHVDRMIKDRVQAMNDQVIFMNTMEHDEIKKILDYIIHKQCREQFGLAVNLTSLYREWGELEKHDKDEFNNDLKHESNLKRIKREARVERAERLRKRQSEDFDHYEQIKQAQIEHLKSYIAENWQDDPAEIEKLISSTQPSAGPDDQDVEATRSSLRHRDARERRARRKSQVSLEKPEGDRPPGRSELTDQGNENNSEE